MDEESKQLLREIRDAQREQLELLRKIYSGVPPWLNIRFSMRHLLAVLTMAAVSLAIITALVRR
jgi:hypothetical protein